MRDSGETLANSIMPPGVIVKRDAVTEGSIVMHDAVTGARMIMGPRIIDKNVETGAMTRIGYGEISQNSAKFTEHLSSSILIVGKKTIVPDGTIIGTNYMVYPGMQENDFAKSWYARAETIGSEAEEDE